MSKFVKLAAAVAVAGALTIGSVSGHAVPFEFDFFKIGGDGTDVGKQLRVTVTEAGTDVSFLFQNLGPIDSSIVNIHFDDGSPTGIQMLLAPPKITNGAGVNLTVGATPEKLPGGNDLDPKFVTTVELNSGAPKGGSQVAQGVEVGQQVEILFAQVFDFNSTIAALLSGALRIGFQVQGIGPDGESAQFVNNPTPIPLPAGLVLFLSGLAGIGVLGRYKAKRRELAAT